MPIRHIYNKVRNRLQRNFSIFDSNIAYLYKVSLLLLGEGNNGGNNSTFIDSSSSSNIITAYNNPPQGMFSPFSGTGSSVYLNGSNQYLTFPTSSNTQFGFGDYTIECWIYRTGNGGSNGSSIVSHYQYGISTDFVLQLTSANKINIYAEYSTGGSISIVSNSIININNWTHIAVCRASGVTRIFINGVLDNYATDTGSYKTPTYPLSIGASGNASANTFFLGYISDIRILKGVGLYLSSFNVPNTILQPIPGTVFLARFNNAQIVDSVFKNNISSNSVTISDIYYRGGKSSMYFNNGYLYIPYNTDLNMNDSVVWTIEGWMRINTSSNIKTLIDFRGNGSTGWYLYVNGSNYLQTTDSTLGTQPAATIAISSQIWQHFALVNNGDITNNMSWYLDGVKCGTFTAVFTATNTTGIRIGSSNIGTNTISGYLDNIIITKGICKYTTDFIPV